MKLAIPDMSCGHCKMAVEQAVAQAAPGAKVDADLATRTAEISGASDTAALLAALAAEGYPARVLQS